MGKLGRFACIFVPMALSIASLVCLILVFSGQLNKNMSLQNDLYFFKADTSEFTENPDLGAIDDLADKVDIDNDILNALQNAASAKDLMDFYKVGLWNYCEGETDDKDKETVTRCSERKANYWFNPIDEWDLEGTAVQKIFSDKDFKDGLDAYKKVSKWMFTAYIIALCLTIAEIIVGIFAIFSRWGSLATTIVSSAQTVFIMAAAITSTALYASLVAIFESFFKPYNIKASLGSKMLAVLWLGVAFSIASGFFWLISVCCCSGKSPHKKVVVEKTPYTYERVASPYLGASGNNNAHNAPAAGHSTSGSAYEPYRQV
ncbi:hypothetical protein CC78DRAFT_11796 [Lojkania enalia]|uniref:Integral membrane protein n=1 Tax=Lojkania enalia TaxID=147567 RepID=A0A9P4NDG6_9PLEO|nr:hypothetical protein CC78DRAFT_11796 [Didymosphaeria enalia]